MNIGDKVMREAQYVQYCVCHGRPSCWCRKTDGWEITSVKESRCQGGYLVKAKRDGKEIPEHISIAYFNEVDKMVNTRTP